MKNYIKIKNIVIKNPKFFLTKEEQLKGFKFDKNPKCGVFPYLHSDIRKFWMKDTPKDLDIVYCQNNKVIAVLQGKANSLDLVGPDAHCDLVVEFPLGFCKRFDIVEGDDVEC